MLFQPPVFQIDGKFANSQIPHEFPLANLAKPYSPHPVPHEFLMTQ